MLGLFSTFGVLDSWDDIVHKGSFLGTIERRKGKIFHLWQHDFSSPAIGTIDELYEVEKSDLPQDILIAYPEADGGMMVKRTYLDTPMANAVFEGIKAGVPYEMSFYFDPLKYDYEAESEGKTVWGEIRHLREVELYETSDVIWGANPATTADVLKTMIRACKSRLDRDALDEILAMFEEKAKVETEIVERKADTSLGLMAERVRLAFLGV